MSECAYCKTETELYENGTPICLGCAEAKAGHPRPAFSASQIRLALLEEVRLTIDRVNAANVSFSLTMQDIPTDEAAPDSALRVTHASQELSIAREAMMRAHRRLDEFLEYGVVPEDFKAI